MHSERYTTMGTLIYCSGRTGDMWLLDCCLTV